SGLDQMHALISLRSTGVTLTDLTKEPDLKINDHVVKSRKIAVGDKIEIGGVSLEAVAPVDMRSATSNIEEDEEIITLVGVEDSPLTEIAIPMEEAIDSADSKSKKAVEGESAMHAHKRKLAEERKELQEAVGKKAPVGMYVVLGIIVVIVTAVVIVNVSEKQKTATAYKELTDYAHTNANPVEVLAKYQEFATEIRGSGSDLEITVADEILRLENKMAEDEADYQEFVENLDEAAAALAGTDQYDQAIDVYKTATLGYRERILKDREKHILALEDRKAAFEAKKAAAAEALARERAILEQKRIAENLTSLSEDVVNALVAGKNDIAVKVLSDAIGDEKYGNDKTGLESSLAMVRLLASHEKILDEKKAAGEEVEIDDDTGINLSGIARTVLLLRKGDIIAANSTLKKADDHFLSDALSQRMKVSSEDLKAEKDAMVSFLKVWRKIVGSPEKVIPKPETCIELMTKEMEKGDRKDIEGLSERLMKCRADYASTLFVKRYTPLFDFVNRKYPSLLLEGSDIASVANGKVIQVDGNDCFVETTLDLDGIEQGQVAIFNTDESFFAAGGDRGLLGARINVLAVYPFKSLGSKQLTFRLPAGDAVPMIDQEILVGSTVAVGQHYISTGKAGNQKLIVDEDFNGGQADGWSSCSTAKIQFDKSRIILNRSLGTWNKKGGKIHPTAPGHFEVTADLGKGGAQLECDLFRMSNNGFSVALGDVSFLIGSDGSYQEGIYIRGRLAAGGDLAGARFGSEEKVSIKMSESKATIAVNGKSVSCSLHAKDMLGVRDRVRFYTAGKVELDNLKVMQLALGSVQGPSVVGLGQGGREVVVHSGGVGDWKLVTENTPVYFFRKDKASGKVAPVVAGRVQEIHGDMFICSVKEGHGLDETCMASPSKQYKSAEASMGIIADPIRLAGELKDAVTYAQVHDEASGKLSLKLDMPVRIPQQSYMYSIGSVITHPHSEEILAVLPSGGLKAAVNQLRTSAVVPLPANVPASTFRSGVLLSAKQIKMGELVEPRGNLQESARRGYSRINLSKPGMWIFDKGQWEATSDGRLAASKKSTGVPILGSTRYSTANTQFDAVVRIEGPSEQAVKGDSKWSKDIMIELFSPAVMDGLTFSLGSEDAAGLWIGGSTLSNVKSGYSLHDKMDIMRGSAVEVEPVWKAGVPPLTVGKDYHIRIRRISDSYLLYLNGKRLAEVKIPILAGDIKILMGSARSRFSVGQSSIRDLPGSAKVGDKESDAGDFGYVLRMDGKRMLVDSDMHGIESGAKVTVMAVDNVVKGKETKTVILKKVAVGTVAELRERTAVVSLASANAALKPGMKVMSGLQPDSLLVTDEWLRDIDKGL
ncbi:hypothetical protein BVX97_03110, partial [bacterium E08(2017)]